MMMMFPGYVNREVLLFLWDQYIIGLDSPGFAEDYLAAHHCYLFVAAQWQTEILQLG